MIIYPWISIIFMFDQNLLWNYFFCLDLEDFDQNWYMSMTDQWRSISTFYSYNSSNGIIIFSALWIKPELRLNK